MRGPAHYQALATARRLAGSPDAELSNLARAYIARDNAVRTAAEQRRVRDGRLRSRLNAMLVRVEDAIGEGVERG